MGRKKVVKDSHDELEIACKLLCDEAANHMKVRNYTRALAVYVKVSAFPSSLLSIRIQQRIRTSMEMTVNLLRYPSTNRKPIESDQLQFQIKKK